MPGMAKYVPTPKADPFKAGDTVQWTESGLRGHAPHLGQLWSRAETPGSGRFEGYGWGRREIRATGKFWWVVREDQSAHLVHEKALRMVQARDEQLSLTA